MKYLAYEDTTSAGQSNLRMSMELATGLAWLTGRTLVLPKRNPLWAPKKAGSVENPVSQGGLTELTDLFDIPITVLEGEDADAVMASEREQIDLGWAPAHESVFCYPGREMADHELFAFFRNGRSNVYWLSEAECAAPVLRLSSRLYSFYSHFFFLPEDTQAALVALLQKVKPKSAFIDFGKNLAAELGSFDAVHIRRGDFVGWAPRSREIEPTELVSNLREVLDRTRTLVICTDAPEETDFFRLLEKEFPNHVYLDRVIAQDRRWRRAFEQLPIHNEIVIGLVSQLVASQAHIFIGTVYSSFSAIVQRCRGLAGVDERFLYTYSPFGAAVLFRGCEFVETRPGPFSWNRVPYPIGPREYSYFREWPESFRAPPTYYAGKEIAKLKFPVLQAVPRRRRGFELYRADSSFFLHDVAASQTYEINQSAALIWDLCDGRRSVSEMVALMTDCFPEANKIMQDEILASLEAMKGLGVLELPMASGNALSCCITQFDAQTGVLVVTGFVDDGWRREGTMSPVLVSLETVAEGGACEHRDISSSVDEAGVFTVPIGDIGIDTRQATVTVAIQGREDIEPVVVEVRA